MVEIERSVEELESWDPGGSGKLVPGIFEAKIVEVKAETSLSGFPKLSFKFQVVDGEYTGCSVFGDRSLHPNALNYFRGLLDVLDCYATGKRFDEQMLVGRYLKIGVIEYQKKDSDDKGLKVDKMFRSDNFAHKNESTDISGMSSSAKGAMAPQAPRRGNGADKLAPAKRTTADDDLPF